MAFRMSEDAVITPITLKNAVEDQTGLINARATNAETVWVDMTEYDRLYAYVACGETFNTSDSVSTLKLQQATSNAGAGVKDITTSGAGSNYNTTNDALAAEDSFAVLECRAEDMDQNNGFRFARLYIAVAGNTGEDDVFGVLIQYNAVHRRKQLQGAYAAATAVYVTPQGASS